MRNCSLFNQGIIQQPIMPIYKVLTPMTELYDIPSYHTFMSCLMQAEDYLGLQELVILLIILFLVLPLFGKQLLTRFPIYFLSIST